MEKRLIHVFVYGNASHADAVGWRVYVHGQTGTYDELIALLRKWAYHDHRIAARRRMPTPIPRREFELKIRLVPLISSVVDEGIIGENNAYCMTHIINDEVRAAQLNAPIGPAPHDR